MRDDGWSRIVPLCRKYTFSLAHLESRVFAAIPGKTVIGPFLEVRNRGNPLTARTWDFNSINSQTRNDMLFCDYQRNGAFCGWNSWPQKWVQTQHRITHTFQKSEGREPCVEEEESNSIRKLVVILLQVDMATRKLVQTISTIFPVILCSKRLSFLRTKESGLLLTPTLRTDELCRYKFPRWSQRWYVTTIKTNENKMDHIIGTPWDRYCWRRLLDMEDKNSQYCVEHKNCFCYFRAIQGHSGGISRVPELMGYTSIPYNWKECIFHRGCSRSVQSILVSGLIPGG